MIMNNQDLKGYYKSFVAAKAPASREKCPSPEEIIQLLRPTFFRKKKTRIIDHVTNCAGCLLEFEYVSRILRHEKKLLQEIEQSFSEREASLAKKRKRMKIFGRPQIWRPLFSWKYALLAAGFIIVTSVLLAIFLLKKPEVYRSEYSAQVKLLQPVNEKISRPSLIFRWKNVERSEYYVLELFDKTLAPIWESEKIETNELALPGEIAESLAVNETYFWMVSASLPGGEKISSRLEEFIIKK